MHVLETVKTCSHSYITCKCTIIIIMHAWFWFSAMIIFMILLFSVCILAATENPVDKSSHVLSQEAISGHRICSILS